MDGILKDIKVLHSSVGQLVYTSTLTKVYEQILEDEIREVDTESSHSIKT